MKVARFSTPGDDPRFAIVDDQDAAAPELVVLAGDPMFAGYHPTGERVPLADAKLLAPVIPRSKVVCVGLNYAEHAKDMAANVDAPDNPLIFLKPNTAVIGPGDAIQIPPVEGRITHESELVVVIGKIAKQVKAANWADYVFGYTCGNDVTASDILFRDASFPQWTRAKGLDGFCPLGPVVATGLDATALRVRTLLDGQVRQDYPISDMTFSVAQLVSRISLDMTLLPGDVILCGTSVGVGSMKPGSLVEVEIEGIGRLANRYG